MANPIIGHVECPHCGDTATVHREARGMRALYYRCYDDDGLSMRCGTVQIRGPSGQRWIDEHKTAARGVVEAGAVQVAAPSREAVDIPPAKVKQAVSEVMQKRRRGLWDLVTTGADDE